MFQIEVVEKLETHIPKGLVVFEIDKQKNYF
jgi:hypothetical protein